MKKYIYLILISSLLFACGNDEPTEDTNNDFIEDPINPERAEKAQMVFQTIPSPIETASLFQSAGAKYHPENTNPIENVDKYVTNTQKALNLGVYGADLSYANIFDESQESMFYMNCSKKMADGLNITSAFDAATIERIEENMNNRDSLMIIINDAFWVVDAHLKENGQSNLSALIITGGWIEGLYLGTKSLNKENPNEDLMKIIAEQKYSLTSLMGLLASYKKDEAVALQQKMKPLVAVFNKIKEIDSELTVSGNEGVSIIGGGSSLEYETAIILEIAIAIEKLRNEIIK